MMKMLKRKAQSGQMLIEPLLAIAIFGLLLAPFLGSISNLAHSQVKYRHQTEAVQYAREGLEIVYNIAVNVDNWSDYFMVDDYHLGTFHPDLSGSRPDLASGSETVRGRFTREINLAKAKRNSSDGNLDEKSGEDDDKTLRVISKVTWDEQGQDQKIELTTYLINLKDF